MIKRHNKPAQDQPVQLEEGTSGWTFETPGFILTREYEHEDKGVFCFRIPEWMFLHMATGFYDVDLRCERSLRMLCLLEMWLFTLYVCMTRVCKNLFKPSDFAFTVLLETLLDEERNPTNNYRLWIFERDASEQYSLARIFMDAVQSDKRIDGSGSFLDHSQPDKALVIHSHHGATGGDSMDGGEVQAPKMDYKEYYKKITSLPSLSGALDTYLNQSRFSDNAKAFVSPEMMAPEIHFSVRNAFRLAAENDKDDDNATKLNIMKAQLDIKNYRIRRGNKIYIQLPFHTHTFKLMPGMFTSGTGYFMTRMFPWRQLNEKHVIWNRYMLALIKQSREKDAREQQYEEIRRSKHSRLSDSDDDDDDDDEDDDPLAKRPPPRLLPNNPAEHQALMRGLNEVYPSMDDGPENFMDAPMRLTSQQVKDTSDLYNYMSDTKKATAGLDDYTARMSIYYRQQKYVLKNQYENDQASLDKALLNLRKIMYEKFETHCTTSRGDDLSEPQRFHNANWTQKNLANMHWKLPIIDPKLSVIENAILWMMEGFTWKDNVATSQFLCFFSYIGIGDRWRREFSLHINLLFSGGNGLGKSVIIENVQKNILESTTKNINGKSDKADAVNGKSTDVVICSDDANLATYFSAVGKDCDAKSHLTTMKTTRAILDLVMEVSPDGTKRTVRKQTQLVFTQIRSLMLGTNESLSDVENNSNGFLQSAKALYNRFLAIEVPCYDNEIHTVSGSIAAQSAKTWEMKETEDEFHDLNNKFDCLRGWAHKLMSIDQDIFYIDMRVFDLVWRSLTANLAKNGIVSDHPRVAIQAKLWCQQLVLFDAYLHAHCLPMSVHYGKTITALSLMDWAPVCFEHHVFITMAAFYRFFVPPSMEPVLDVLTLLMEDSFKNQDKRVVFAEKQRRIIELDKQAKQDEMNTRMYKNISRQGRSGRPRNGHPDEDDGESEMPLGAALNLHMQRMSPEEQARVAAEERARFRQNPQRDDEHIDVQVDPEEAATADKPQAKMPLIDATYVNFNFSFDAFAAYAQVRMRAMRSPMQPGHSAIVSALKRLGNTAVKSSRYVLETLDQTTPTLDDKHPSIIQQGLVKPNRYDMFQVHYAVLVKNGHFRSALTNAINSYCHQNVLPRKIMIAIENPRYPFVLGAMDIKPGKRPLKVRNPSYVMQTTMATYRGASDRMRALHRSEQPMNWQFNDYDMDTLGLIDYFKGSLDSGMMSMEDVMAHHPARVTYHLTKLAEKKLFEKGSAAALNYPGDWLKEYAAVEYSNRKTEEDDDEIDEMAMQPAERLEREKQQAETDKYMKLHGIIESASYLSSIIDINKVDDHGVPLGLSLQMCFNDVKGIAGDVNNSKIYDLMHMSDRDLAKEALLSTETDGQTAKEFNKAARKRKEMVMRKAKRMEFDFAAMALQYPSAREQHQQQRDSQRAIREAEDAVIEQVRRARENERNNNNNNNNNNSRRKKRTLPGDDDLADDDDDDDEEEDVDDGDDNSDNGELDGLRQRIDEMLEIDELDEVVDEQRIRVREEYFKDIGQA